MSNKNNGFNDFQNSTLYLIILTILLTYNVTYIFSMSNSNLTIATFSNKLSYNNSKLNLLSLSNKKESKSSFTDFSLDDDRYYSYYLNTSQKKLIYIKLSLRPKIKAGQRIFLMNLSTTQ